MLLRSGDNLYPEMRRLIRSSSSLTLIAPFIKFDALQSLLENTGSCQQIIVRWETNDIISGASDLEIYDYCVANNISLFVNRQIHLKVLIDSFQRCFIGSPNITKSGLSADPNRKYNYEIGAIVEQLSEVDNLYFQKIIYASKLVSEDWYLRFKDHIKNLKHDTPVVDEYPLDELEDHFLISSLPMSYSVNDLAKFYLNGIAEDEEARNCAVHDLIIYQIPQGLSYQEFIVQLSRAFFSHPFIVALSSYMLKQGGELYFGRAKEWIQANCTTVPTPRRWELTTNTQILYSWFVGLGHGEYAIDVPGSKSQRLYIVE